jgi:hypothetical protein
MQASLVAIANRINRSPLKNLKAQKNLGHKNQKKHLRNNRNKKLMEQEYLRALLLKHWRAKKVSIYLNLEKVQDPMEEF